ncbi:MAG: response regulator, partial [Deltaproteobacteria bacterium]|nr:response regulator [Deltaproteobacteria bacterium]
MTEGQATILVVDDDAAMTSAVAEVLRQSGYLPLSAQSGLEALEIVKRDEPDLLISDLRMAEMSGHRLQQELQTIAPNLPVVMITAFGT